MAFFTPDFIAFFQELEADNHRDWFQANRKRYLKSVKAPFEAFVATLIGHIQARDPEVAIAPSDAIFRINRDIRFSPDKRPYKLFAGALISPAGRRDMQTPGFYFQLGGHGAMIAGGAYQPDTAHRDRIRAAIAERGEVLEAALADPAFVERFGTLQGEQNKVLPREFKPHLERYPMIANKQFFYMAELPDPAVVLRDDLDALLMEHYRAAEGVQAFLRQALV